MTPDVFLSLRDTELAAIKALQIQLADRDRRKRTRALKDYRRLLDWLKRIGRITEEQRAKLEYYRMEDRHVRPE